MRTDPSAPGVYVVKKGDTLSDVARRFNLTMEQLLAHNEQFKAGSADGKVADRTSEKVRAKVGFDERDADFIMPGEQINVGGAGKPVDQARPADKDKSAQPKAASRPADAAPGKAAASAAQPPASAAGAPPAPPAHASSAAGAPAPADAPKGKSADQAAAGKKPAEAPKPVSGGLAQGNGAPGSQPSVVTEDARITAAGLQGSTSDPVLANVPRLAAMRSMADGVGPNGKVDGKVDAGEAAAYLAAAKKAAVIAGSNDMDSTSLSGKEQQSVIAQRLANTETRIKAGTATAEDVASVPALRKALATYGESSASVRRLSRQEASVHGEAMSLAGGMSAGLHASPDGAALLDQSQVNLLLMGNQGSSLSLKVFTPNLDARDIAMLGDRFKMTRADYDQKRDLQGKFPKADNPSKSGTIKAHGWLAAKLEVGVGPATMGLDNKTLRTASFTSSASAQTEIVADGYMPHGDVRGFVTTNKSMNVQYTVTTEESRLRDILSGKVKAPDPRTLEGMKPGDVMQVWVGPSFMREFEGRAMLGKGAARAGLSAKYDIGEQSGKKIMIRMIANKDNPDKPHIQVYDGTKSTEIDVRSLGLIANPRITKDNPYSDDLNGAFLRALMQKRLENTHEAYNFVEIDPSDTSKGGGAELLKSVLVNGNIPVDPSGKAIKGALAHGTHNLDAQTEATTLQMSAYGEAKTKVAGRVPSATPGKAYDMVSGAGARGGAQVMAQYSPDLAMRISATRNEVVRQSRPGSYVGVNGSTTDKLQLSEFGRSTLHKVTVTDPSSGTKQVQSGLVEKDVLSGQLGKSLDPRMFQSITLNTPKGKLEGQAAIDYLNKNKRPDKGILDIFNPERANVTMRFDSWDKARELETRFKKEQLAYKEKHSSVVDSYYQAQMAQTVAIGAVMGQNVANDPNLWFNVAAQQKAKTTEQSFQQVTGYPMTSFLQAMRGYRSENGNQQPYPAHIEITVDY